MLKTGRKVAVVGERVNGLGLALAREEPVEEEAEKEKDDNWEPGSGKSVDARGHSMRQARRT